MLKIFPENQPESIRRIALNGVPDNALLIYKGRNRVFSLLVDGGREINIKEFHKPRFPNSYIYNSLRRSKACRSFLNAKKLIELGFHTPQPIAFIEETSAGALRRSYYISQQVPFKPIRDWTTIPGYETLIDDLGAEINRLMTAGVFHRDFSPGNILYQPLPDGHFRFYYVDLNRMEFNVTSTAKLMRMFRAITLDEDELSMLAAAYARAAGLPEQTVINRAIAQLRSYIAEKKRLKKIKSIFK
ncbi:MAG: lipopolysaccharide kinase InaA family protein [Muribaculaceae bacterium]|nr:lipopolysaccharide kinase InaA family protein [Muribaculaceae bacterium]